MMPGKGCSKKGVDPRVSPGPRFWNLKVGHIYRVRPFLSGRTYRIAWSGYPQDHDVVDLGLVVKIDIRTKSMYEGCSGPIDVYEIEWATFLIGEKTLDVCRDNEDLPWSTYFELEQ